MNLDNKSERVVIYEKLAKVLSKHTITLSRLLADSSVVDLIAEDVQKEVDLNKSQLLELLKYIDKHTSLGKRDRVSSALRPKRLPDLNDYDRRRTVQTRARYGKWYED